MLSGMAKQSLHDRTKGRGVMSLISDTRDKLITVICDMNPHVIPPSLRLHHDEIDLILTDMVAKIKKLTLAPFIYPEIRDEYSASKIEDVFQQIRGE